MRHLSTAALLALTTLATPVAANDDVVCQRMLARESDVEENTFYQRNTADLGKLISGFTMTRD